MGDTSSPAAVRTTTGLAVIALPREMFMTPTTTKNLRKQPKRARLSKALPKLERHICIQINSYVMIDRILSLALIIKEEGFSHNWRFLHRKPRFWIYAYMLKKIFLPTVFPQDFLVHMK